MQALRDALGRNRIVSLAAGAGDYFVRDTEMDKVAEIVDYVQLMTYDMRNGNTRQAGHHAALGASKGDDETTSTRYIVDLFHRAGVGRLNNMGWCAVQYGHRQLRNKHCVKGLGV